MHKQNTYRYTYFRSNTAEVTHAQLIMPTDRGKDRQVGSLQLGQEDCLGIDEIGVDHCVDLTLLHAGQAQEPVLACDRHVFQVRGHGKAVANGT